MEQPCSAVSKRQLQVRWRKVAGSKGKSSMRCSYRRRQSGKESDESSFHPAVLSKRKSNPRRAAALSHTERFRLSGGGFKPSSSAVLSGCRSPRWSHAFDEWEQQHKRRQTPRTRRMLTNHNGSCSSRTRQCYRWLVGRARVNLARALLVGVSMKIAKACEQL